MAKVSQKTSPPLKPKTTSFLGCFRFSNNKTLRLHDYNDHNKKIIKSRSWFCWSRFRVKKAAATKTVVPLDVSIEKQATMSKSELKSKHGKLEPITEVPATIDVVEDPGVPIQPLIVPDRTPDAKQKPLQKETASDMINLENKTQGSDASKDYASQKRRLSFCRKVESIRTAAAGGAGGSQPGSPVQHQENKSRLGTAAVISPPATLLPVTPKRSRRSGGGGGGSSAMPSSARKAWLVSNERTMTTKRLDPLVGMAIIMVTLIIMVLWGRLCAILCTAAWLYLLPSLTQSSNLTTSITSSTAGNGFPHPRDEHLDFSSDEYKKKVVLEGFLERNNHRNHAVLSYIVNPTSCL